MGIKATQADEMPLQPQVSLEPFDKWGFNFDPSNQQHFILGCINYISKWVEVKALSDAKEDKVAEFSYGNIFTRFGVPHEIVTHQGPQFTSPKALGQ